MSIPLLINVYLINISLVLVLFESSIFYLNVIKEKISGAVILGKMFKVLGLIASVLAVSISAGKACNFHLKIHLTSNICESGPMPTP